MFIGIFLLIIVLATLYIEDDASNVEIVEDVPLDAKEVKGKRVF